MSASAESDFSISWTAEIIPSQSIAGIPIGVSVENFDRVLGKYLVDESKGLYRFEGSPVLSSEKYFDANGNGGYGFSVFDLELTRWRLYYDRPDHAGVDSRAFHVLFRAGKVFAIKVWLFESLRVGENPSSSYAGKLKEGIGLGDLVRDFLAYTELEYDSAEEWFYTDQNYGGLEVTGYSAGDLTDWPDQNIRVLTIIPNSAFGTDG